MSDRTKEQVPAGSALEPEELLRESRVGWVAGVADGGAVLVDFPGNRRGPLLAEPLPAMPAEARVDGQRVVIEGRDEVVLRCGKATLTLRRDGQVILRGVNIRTDAEEIHRIRGGKVQIN